MSATVVVGLQYGDEGKGKIVDWLAEKYRVIVRYNGGPNAGHTVVNDRGEFKLHQVPSGIFNPEARCCLASGAVIDSVQLVRELEMLAGRGVATEGFGLSERAHVILPWHQLADRLSEASRGGKAIGTTGRGIGPCYADKVNRTGLSVAAAIEAGAEGLRQECDARVGQLARLYHGQDAFRTGDVQAQEMRHRAAEAYEALITLSLMDRVSDTDAVIRRAWKAGDPIMLEGAQGTMIDLNYGTYPYVSSSTSTAAGACIGSGLPPTAITRVIGVAKAYATRVGAGPFPTELTDASGDRLRALGKEFGTTTGRPRRCGWFDAADARYAAEVNGATEIVLTKLDVLSPFGTIRVATHRERDAAGDATYYEELPGWKTPIDGATSWSALPPAAKRYVARLEELIGVPITHVATGPGRQAIIER